MPPRETACLLGLLGAPVVWFLSSLGALLGGPEFVVPAILSLQAVDPTDFMFLKDVFSGIWYFEKVSNADPGLFLSKMAPQKRSLSCEGLVLSL